MKDLIATGITVTIVWFVCFVVSEISNYLFSHYFSIKPETLISFVALWCGVEMITQTDKKTKCNCGCK